MCYAWEVFTRKEFESLFEMKKPEKTPIANHWLTSGEIWTLCGLQKYGTSVQTWNTASFHTHSAIPVKRLETIASER